MKDEGYHIYGVGVCRDDGCAFHGSCLNCSEKLPCIDDDRRLSHHEWLWLRHMATLLRADGRDKKYPELYQKALDRLKAFCIYRSKQERKRIRVITLEGVKNWPGKMTLSMRSSGLGRAPE
ncbi:hypothetical protein ES703_31179 [subsurface metagenome]